MSTPRVNLLPRAQKAPAPTLKSQEQFHAFLVRTLLVGLALFSLSLIVLALGFQLQARWLVVPHLLLNIGAFLFVSHRLDTHTRCVTAALDGMKVHELVSLVGQRHCCDVSVGQVLAAIDRKRR